MTTRFSPWTPGDLVTLGFETELDATKAAWHAGVVLGAAAEIEQRGAVVTVRTAHGAETAPGLVTELAWQGVPVTRLDLALAPSLRASAG